jgi:hypothetical protein
MGARLVDGVLVMDDGSESPLMEAVEDDPLEAPIASPSGSSPTCEVCGIPLPYSGRGRPPKYCADDKPVSPRRTGSAGPVRSASFKNEAALRDALLSRYMQMGNVLSMLHPAYGMGVKQKAQEAVNADIEYARVNPAFRRTLESMLEKTALGAVIAVHAAMLAPVAIGMKASQMRKSAEKATVKANAPRPAAARTATPMPSRPVAVPDYYPGDQSDAAPETVNAAAMPGMPSV